MRPPSQLRHRGRRHSHNAVTVWQTHGSIERQLPGDFFPQTVSKETHLDRMRESAHFRFTCEVLLHKIEQGDAARFLEMILTNAFSHQFKLQTITEQEIGFDRLRQAALQSIGSEPIPRYFSYRVRVGIK